MTDAGMSDAGMSDAGMSETGITDAGITDAWFADHAGADLVSDRLVLVPMSLEVMETLLRGDRDAAQQMVRYRIPQDWPMAIASTLKFRIPLARAHPGSLPLLFRVMVLRADPEVVVGRIGFHGPADEVGMVEIGYEVFPAFRRQGYAREAVVAMLRMARRDPEVRLFRATVSPDNLPSRRLVTGLGLVEVGVQWDEVDGEETIFEVESGCLDA
jgi:ribosomal-protein-alanine N-acetyltransferase